VFKIRKRSRILRNF